MPAVDEQVTAGAPAGEGWVADVRTRLTRGPDSVTVRSVIPTADAGLDATWEGWCMDSCRSGAASWADGRGQSFLGSYSKTVPFTLTKGRELVVAFRIRVTTQRGLVLLQDHCLYLHGFQVELDDGTRYTIENPASQSLGDGVLVVYGGASSKSFQNCPQAYGTHPGAPRPSQSPAPTPT